MRYFNFSMNTDSFEVKDHFHGVISKEKESFSHLFHQSISESGINGIDLYT